MRARGRQQHHVAAAEPMDLSPQGLQIYEAESKDCLPQVKEASWIIDFSSSMSFFSSLLFFLLACQCDKY